MYSDNKNIYYTNGQSWCISWCWTLMDTHSQLCSPARAVLLQIPHSTVAPLGNITNHFSLVLSLLQVLQLVLKFQHETFEVSNYLASLRYVGCLSNRHQGRGTMSYPLELTHTFLTTSFSNNKILCQQFISYLSPWYYHQLAHCHRVCWSMDIPHPSLMQETTEVGTWRSTWKHLHHSGGNWQHLTSFRWWGHLNLQVLVHPTLTSYVL